MELLAACAEGKNVYTEIKCTSLLPLEDVVRVVTHEDCITEVLHRVCVGVCVCFCPLSLSLNTCPLCVCVCR